MDDKLILYYKTKADAYLTDNKGDYITDLLGNRVSVTGNEIVIPFPSEEEPVYIGSYTYDANRMGGSPQISATVKHRLCLDDLWNDKVYAAFRGEKYFIMNTPSSDKDNTDERYNHDIQLLSEREVLNHVYFIDAVQGDSTVDVYKSNSTKVIFFGDVNEFVGRLNACLSYQKLDYTAVVDEGVTSKEAQVSFEDKYILEALQEIFNVYEIPYYFVGKVIHVGYTENTITYPLKYGFDEALLSISKQNANYALINKIKGQGSSDNIPYYYPNESDDREAIEAAGKKWITPMPNLMPSIYRESLGAQQFYEAKNNTYEDGEGGYYEFENEYSDTNQRQGTTDFEDIKPTIEGMTNAKGQRIDMFSAFAYDKNDNDEVDEEGNYIHSYFFAKLRKFDGENGFNLFDHAIESQAMQISFTSGVCGACTFEIGVGEETQKNIVQVDEFGNLKRDESGNVLWENQSPQDRQNDTRNYEVWIALKKETDTYGIVFPNASQNLKPSTDDTFVILGINLPTAYITAAEKRLEQSLIKYMWMNNTEKFTFSIKFSRIFFTEHPEVLEQLNENSRVLIEYNGQQHTLYVDNFSYKTDDSSPLPEIEIDLVDTLSIGQNSLQTQLDSVKQDILSSIGGGGDFLKQGLKYFLRKDVNDVAQGKITFRKGLDSKSDVVIGENGFAGGLTGFGAKIGSDGRAEMRALTLWEFLEVPELRYNSVKVFLGIDWQVAGAGIIESCTPDTDSEGNILSTGTCTLKLEEGQYGAVDVGDIALGIWHFGNSNDATEDTDDGKGGFTFAGFATAYFRITEVSGANNGTFRYSLRPNFNVHPQSQMTFACYGNFTNVDRQTSTYRTRTYTRRLWKQNTWEIGVQNIAMQEGDLSNLSIFDMDMTGYSIYINSVYFTGTIAQVKPDGTPVMTANDRGAWVNNTTYDYYDRVSHNGCIWLCVNEDGTDTEPSESNPNWLLQVSKGDNGQDGTSFRILGSKDDESQLPTDGNEIGDGYLINGHLWVWNGTEWNDAGVIQGPAGESVINMGGWYEGLHVPYLGVVRMGNATFMCTVENGTYNPPYYTLLDNSGNRLKTNLGYIITGDINNAEYQLIAADGADGKDGLDGVAGKDGVDGKTYYTWIRYADDAEGNGISNDPTGKAYIGFAYNKESPLESNDPTDYIWSDIKGEQGVKGEKGEDGTQYYTWIAYSDNPDGNPMYQQPTDTTKYIGIAVNKTTEIEGTDPSEYTWSKFRGEDGKDGLNGADGVDGKDGTSIVWKGEFTSAPSNPQNGWAYKNTTDKKSYVYQDGSWYQMTIDGVDGQNGVDGLSIVWKGDLAEAPANPQTNWAYRDTDNGRVYIYNGSAWELMVVDGTDGADGAKGDNGYSVYITYNDSETEPSIPTGNGTTNGWHTDATSTAIWMSQKVAASSSDGTWGNPIKIKGQQGDKGDGYTQMGQWYSGMVVPKMGVVSMGGGSYVAKVATTNPPLWTIIDNNGNRLKCSSGYLLTGSVNTSEYDVWSEKGDKGDTGEKGEQGDKGEQGEKGDKGDTGAQGKQGIDGCIVRDSEWAIGTEYRNDSNITDGSLEVRYIDVALVRNDAVATGWDAYRCKLTHVASSSITYTNTSYWEKFSTNVGTIFTSLIIAKNAKIQFLQGNQLTIQKSDGTITAGLSGSEDGEKIRIWAGGEAPDTAVFRVSESGKLYASDVEIEGSLKSGSVGDFVIDGGIKNLSDSPTAYIQIEKNGGKFFRVNMSDYTMCAIRADSATALSLSTYGSSNASIGLDIICNASGYGYAIRSSGNILMTARPGELIKTIGHAVNARYVYTSISLTSADDSIIFSNTSNITVSLPTANAFMGKIYYMKRIGTGTVTLSANNFVSQDKSTENKTTYVISDNKPRIFIFIAEDWYEFYCGN